MSLKDPDDEYDEIIKEKHIIPKNIIKKNKLILFTLIIGLIIGSFLQYSLINPLMIDMSSNDCTTIKNTNKMLNEENDCLYYILDSQAKTASEKCATRNWIQNNQEEE
ncbi:MAG: hypothetical protein PHY04_02300 [Candidatus ainarchaeum sp.]|jgi:hypothetical protein|nr:hypothetical protein [Candidatus ainarchaeum sp.]MDD3085732.1 hypothetical protein [Candidatus ainarchaeum sp.]MDD4128544.1 hypothetical protein [Candidatus ainarchaeum sp.]MDD4467799.1 hypothetical protein [Candidatus ainarchaeum sp.]HPM85576.1 hypothetical protein [archaeon]